MIAHYGFTDASGDWYVTIDTDRCNGCAKCVEVCPSKALEVGPDEIDIFREEPVVFISNDKRNRIRNTCAPCKPGFPEIPAPCVRVCEFGAISHSDGWKGLCSGSSIKPKPKRTF